MLFTINHYWEDGTNLEITNTQILRIEINISEDYIDGENDNGEHEILISAYVENNHFVLHVSKFDNKYIPFLRSFFGEAGILAYVRERFIMHYGISIKGALIPR